MDAPKVFISYSWSGPEHEQWVLDLATRLRESRIDVILDKWDLKEGHDAVKFMEKMVADESIRKVLIISDEVYARKADDRDGGVGTETQIISKEIYDDQEQDKFVVVLAEKDDTGKPFLPIYYKSRIYIDLCDPEKGAEEFEKLLRWVFDRPLYVKPELGSKPSFLEDDESISAGTTATFRRALDAIRNSKPYALGALDEYLNTLGANLERFRLQKPEGEFDEAVFVSIQNLLPCRNEVLQVFSAISQYAMNDEIIQTIHRFFESLLPYTQRPEDVSSYSDWDYDNFLFIIHELFLCTIAIIIKDEHYDWARFLLEQEYYVAGNSDYGRDEMVDFRVFRRHMKSLAYRNERLNLGRASIRADLLKERCAGPGAGFRYVMQADFVLFLRADIKAAGGFGWYPETLLYLGYSSRPFEIFARSESSKYFDKVKRLLGIDSPEDLDNLLLSYKENRQRLPGRNVEAFTILNALNYERLAKKP